jgi:hypothetical protein
LRSAPGTEDNSAQPLVRNLSTPLANLPDPSWHALYFGIGYFVVGMAMTLTLAGALRDIRSRAI